jgi:hypothetical protein
LVHPWAVDSFGTALAYRPRSTSWVCYIDILSHGRRENCCHRSPFQSLRVAIPRTPAVSTSHFIYGREAKRIQGYQEHSPSARLVPAAMLHDGPNKIPNPEQVPPVVPRPGVVGWFYGKNPPAETNASDDTTADTYAEAEPPEQKAINRTAPTRGILAPQRASVSLPLEVAKETASGGGTHCFYCFLADWFWNMTGKRARSTQYQAMQRADYWPSTESARARGEARASEFLLVRLRAPNSTIQT